MNSKLTSGLEANVKADVEGGYKSSSTYRRVVKEYLDENIKKCYDEMLQPSGEDNPAWVRNQSILLAKVVSFKELKKLL